MREKYFSLSYLGVTFMGFDVSIAVNGQKLLFLFHIIHLEPSRLLNLTFNKCLRCPRVVSRNSQTIYYSCDTDSDTQDL